MNSITTHGGEAVMNLGAGFLTGAIVSAAFAPAVPQGYGWLAALGVGLLAAGFILKFVKEDWTL